MDSVFASLRRRAFAELLDDELLNRFTTRGDDDAFAELVRRHGPLVYAAARRRLSNDADASDVFQATFLVLVRKASRLTDRHSLGPWLYRVAALTARNVSRRNANRPAELLTDIPQTEHDASVRWDLDEALLHLSERDRSAVVLCHIQGYTREEAAVRLGLPEGTLSAILHRALGRLRAKLSGDPRVLASLASVVVPVGLASATCRAAGAVRCAGFAAAGTQVAAIATGTLRQFFVKPFAIVVGLLSLGLGLGAGAYYLGQSQAPTVVKESAPPLPACPWVTVDVRSNGLRWREFDQPGDVRERETVVDVAVRSPEELRVLLVRQISQLGSRSMQVTLNAERAVPPEQLLAAVQSIHSSGITMVRYTGPLPLISVDLGRETCNWNEYRVQTDPAATHLPTYFSLGELMHTHDGEASALRTLARLRAVITRDGSRASGPIVSVSLAHRSATDADLSVLQSLAQLKQLDLTSCRGISDRAVELLLQARPLSDLNLTESSISRATVEKLRRDHPMCRIEFHPE